MKKYVDWEAAGVVINSVQLRGDRDNDRRA